MLVKLQAIKRKWTLILKAILYEVKKTRPESEDQDRDHGIS